MAKRLIRFFLYGVLFALIPFLATCFLHIASPNLKVADIRLSPELLIFALALNAVGHAALYDLTERDNRDVLVESLRGGHVIGLIAAALLYGAHAYARDVTADHGTFIVVVFWCSVILAVLSLGIALSTEILVGKLKANVEQG